MLHIMAFHEQLADAEFLCFFEIKASFPLKEGNYISSKSCSPLHAAFIHLRVPLNLIWIWNSAWLWCTDTKFYIIYTVKSIRVSLFEEKLLNVRLQSVLKHIITADRYMFFYFPLCIIFFSFLLVMSNIGVCRNSQSAYETGNVLINFRV